MCRKFYTVNTFKSTGGHKELCEDERLVTQGTQNGWEKGKGEIRGKRTDNMII
jgi:hypothetical protein